MGPLPNRRRDKRIENIGTSMLDRKRTTEFGDRPVPQPGKEPEWVAENRRLTAWTRVRPPPSLNVRRQ